MKRRTAIRLYRFLFFTQIVALFWGTIDLLSELRSGIQLYYLVGFLVGGTIGLSMAVLLFREWKAVEAVSEEKWNQAWFIQPSKKHQP